LSRLLFILQSRSECPKRRNETTQVAIADLTIFSDIRYCSGGIIKAEEDKLDFLLLSGTTSELKLILIHNTTSYYVLERLNKGGQWNYYSILSNDKTVYVRKNGVIIKRYYNVVLQQITAKISSGDSSWKIWNVCGHGAVEPCKITCSNYGDFNNKTEKEPKGKL
jgi:hypothetical protein